MNLIEAGVDYNYDRDADTYKSGQTFSTMLQ